jgi:hypothetical protein
MRDALRSVLVCGVSFVLMTACGSEKTTLVQAKAPTGNASSITVAPSSANLTVGGTVALVATVVADSGLAHTVTWSSGNTAVATVSATGLVTAVAVGSVAITATSTADTTATGGASITVLAPVTTPVVNTPATITIASITQGANTAGLTTGGVVNTSNVVGQINANVVYDPGTQTVTSIALLLTPSGSSTSVTCAQESIGSASSSLAPNAAATDLTLTCNTAAFDTTQTKQASVTSLKNGQYTLSAKLTTTGSSATAQGPVVTFNNTDFIIANFASPSTTPGAGQIAQASDPFGFTWRAGAVNVALRPVIYTSGRSITSATVSLANGGGGITASTVDAVKNGASVPCAGTLASQTVTTFPTLATFALTTTNGVAPASSVATVTADTAAVSVFTVDNLGNSGPQVVGTGTSCGGAPFVPAASVVAGNFLRLDNAGVLPGAYVFSNGNTSNIIFANLPGDTVTDNNTQFYLPFGGSTVWLDTSYMFNGAVNNGYVANTTSLGVGGVTVSFQYTAAPFVATSVWTTVTSADQIPQSFTATAYNLRMVETDALGNSTITNITFGGGTATTSTFGVAPGALLSNPLLSELRAPLVPYGLHDR